MGALTSAGVYTLFATHFSALRQLETLYPSCKVCQFAVDTSAGRFKCTWQLKAGIVDVPHYGLLLAADSGFPAEVRHHRLTLPAVSRHAPAHSSKSLAHCLFWGLEGLADGRMYCAKVHARCRKVKRRKISQINLAGLPFCIEGELQGCCLSNAPQPYGSCHSSQAEGSLPTVQPLHDQLCLSWVASWSTTSGLVSCRRKRNGHEAGVGGLWAHLHLEGHMAQVI